MNDYYDQPENQHNLFLENTEKSLLKKAVFQNSIALDITVSQGSIQTLSCILIPVYLIIFINLSNDTSENLE